MPSGKYLAKKVLLIGWDGADWKVINPLLDSGKMPTLERFINKGVMGNLASLSPTLSPLLWTSIATGMRPFKHGILHFTEPDPYTGGIRPVTSTSRAVKAIWNILNQNGYKSNIIGWWPSHPAEPINGVMVSSGGDAAIHVGRDLEISARAQSLRAELGDISLKANDDIRLDGERIRNNC